ncbi:melatonin receptor type 1B [Perognathus longimembris pacificus]|uniref:melatonin receptor type 1B n=1 Tax=Perognathus longimembris pacificus TaxID=214514 RepID=UPI002019B94B|nr:melatonin receptor type 1B [Perognathus longimembris pacificus]
MLENASFTNCCEPGGLALHPGWREADGPPPSRSARLPWVAPALSTVLIVTTAVDVVGNLLVILSVLRNRKLRNAGNLFLVNLAMADLVVALYPYPLILLAISTGGWALGELHCKASAFVMGLSVIGSVFNITAIAINRYCYICHRRAYHRLCGPRHVPLYIGLIWLLTLVALVPNFFVGSLEYDPRIYSCTFIQTASARYTAAVVAIHFLLPLTAVAFCYLRIWAFVLQARRKAKAESKPHLRPSDVRSFLSMFTVFAIFAVCWAPLNGIGLAVAIDPQALAARVPEGLFVTSYFLAYFHSCLNAIVYGMLNQNFRREYARIISELCAPRGCHAAALSASHGGHADRLPRRAPAILPTQPRAQATTL